MLLLGVGRFARGALRQGGAPAKWPLQSVVPPLLPHRRKAASGFDGLIRPTAVTAGNVELDRRHFRLAKSRRQPLALTSAEVRCCPVPSGDNAAGYRWQIHWRAKQITGLTGGANSCIFYFLSVSFATTFSSILIALLAFLAEAID